MLKSLTALVTFILLLASFVGRAACSTYVVYVPLDSPIYVQLDTLNGLGVLETYLEEVRPISRVEAARLTSRRSA